MRYFRFAMLRFVRYKAKKEEAAQHDEGHWRPGIKKKQIKKEPKKAKGRGKGKK